MNGSTPSSSFSSLSSLFDCRLELSLSPCFWNLCQRVPEEETDKTTAVQPFPQDQTNRQPYFQNPYITENDSQPSHMSVRRTTYTTRHRTDMPYWSTKEEREIHNTLQHSSKYEFWYTNKNETCHWNRYLGMHIFTLWSHCTKCECHSMNSLIDHANVPSLVIGSNS